MEKQLLELIGQCEVMIIKESIEEVMHFYNHGEYEMALEGLIIEIMKINSYPESVDIDLIKKLVLYYKLDSESVFDYQFGEKFEQWFSKQV